MTEAQQKAEAFLAEYKELCVRHGHVVGLSLTGPAERLAVRHVVPSLVLAHVACLTDQIKKDHEGKKPKRAAAEPSRMMKISENDPIVGTVPMGTARTVYETDPAAGTGLGPFAPEPPAVPPTTIDSGAGDWSGGSADSGSFDSGGSDGGGGGGD